MSGRRRTYASAIVYEDFRPQVERKEEQGANILLIHLPGFLKEQISVNYVDTSRTIKVEAERAVGKDKRSRFNQSFPLPQNCVPEKLQGTFRNGILTITVPIKTIPQDGNTANETEPTKLDPKKEETTLPKAAKLRDEKAVPQKATPEPKAPTAMVPPPKVQTVEALQPSKQQEETQKKYAPNPIATTTKQTEEKDLSSSEAQKPVKERAKSKENSKTKDSAMYDRNLPKKISEKGKKDDKAGGAVEKKPKESGSSFLEKAKEIKGVDTIMKTVKRFAKDDYEDRQLLINIGISVLAIAALGAYITYRYRSSGKATEE